MNKKKWSTYAQATRAKKDAAEQNKANNGAASASTTSGTSNAFAAPTGPRAAGRGDAFPGVMRRTGGFAQPSVVPVTAQAFTWQEVVYLSKTSGTVNLIPLRNPTKGPLCIRFVGGGSIPHAIGLQINSYGQPHVTFTMDSPEEQRCMDLMHSGLCDDAIKYAEQWYPGETVDATTLVGRILSEVKPKKDGGGEWPRLASANISENDLYAKDDREDPALIIVNENGQRIYNLPDILAQKWTAMTIELKSLVLGHNEKTNQPHVSISRRIRRLNIAIDENAHHTVFPCDRVLHDKTECKRKHTIITPIAEFSLIRDAIIHDLKTKDKTTSARIEHKNGGDVVIKLTGGGTLPPFFCDVNRENKHVITVSIDNDDDEKRLDGIVEELRTIAIERRASYFPKSKDQDDLLKRCVKRVLGKKSDKPEHAKFSRAFGCITDLENLGTTVVIVDGNGEKITDPEQMKYQKWEELWFALRCTYMKVVGEFFEVGFSKRLIYLQLAREMSSYRLEEGPVAEPDPKRPRTN